jgi:hypothetical protein
MWESLSPGTTSMFVFSDCRCSCFLLMGMMLQDEGLKSYELCDEDVED